MCSHPRAVECVVCPCYCPLLHGADLQYLHVYKAPRQRNNRADTQVSQAVHQHTVAVASLDLRSIAGARSVASLRNPYYTLSLTTAIKRVELDKLIKTTAGTSDSQQSAFEYSVITNDATRKQVRGSHKGSRHSGQVNSIPTER